jgi:general secretion pathway protein J
MRNQGFTLIEILVVLIITSMVVILLMQGMLQVQAIQARYGHEFFRGQQGSMQIDWYRQSINALVSVSPNAAIPPFQGESQRIRGPSMAPLMPESGALAAIQWQLRFDEVKGKTGLYYGENIQEPPLISWEGDTGHFVYLDQDGQRHESWPPFLGKWPQLPAAVFLEYGHDKDRQLIVAAPLGRQDPPVTRQITESSI